MHREYQNYVATGVMTLRVFALQFLDGHHYAEDGNAAEKNIHRKALGAVSILLLERIDLVRQFFSRPSVEVPDINKVIFLVYTERRGAGKQNQKRRIRPVKQEVIPSLNCLIEEEDMILLAECANHTAFFKDMIDSVTISVLLHCRLSVPLIADNLMGFAYFFDQLSEMHLVGRNWQTTLERCGAILLQGKNKPQTHSNFSSALNRAKSNGICRYRDDIGILMKHIREKYTR